MRARTIERESEVVLEPESGTADASVIWMHGLGADGYDFVPLVPELQLPSQARVRFMFPHAEVRPVTINGGYAMRAWYDIRELSPAGRDDEQGFAEARQRIESLIKREVDAGIPSSRILLAGFSQGGAVALHVGLRHAQTLGGILALSCYLPMHARLATELTPAARATPILMCHGTEDPVVAQQFGALSRDVMKGAGLVVDWREYRMGHTLCIEEISDLSAWLRERLTLQ
jgi:phospholipase/carboxylesterase